MTWNYRVVRDGDGSCTIREVYYDDDGKISYWTSEPCYPVGENWVECMDNLAMMGQALSTHIVDVSSGQVVEVPLKEARGRVRA